MPQIELSRAELRAVTAYAVACARPALALLEHDRADDRRSHAAIEAAAAFANGAERTKVLRDCAWAALRAAREMRDAGQPIASEVARAASAACGAAFLHPLAKATQVKHILGSAAYATHAFELAGLRPRSVIELATSDVIAVLGRYPPAPAGGGRVGEIMRELCTQLRGTRAKIGVV